jgi:hypothetical protein
MYVEAVRTLIDHACSWSTVSSFFATASRSREQPPRHGKEDGDEEMLGYTAVADGPVGLDTWIQSKAK